MEKEIISGNGKINYLFRRSSRARRVRLTVKRDGRVLLTAPVRISESVAENFLREKAVWVISKLNHFAALPSVPVEFASHRGRKDYLKHREEARAVIEVKVAQFGILYGYPYGRISIKNQKSCWGSCSRKGNLNFNYKILFLPERLQDYVIVHELCHLKEMNHSRKFWELVAQTVPDHVARRRELRKSGLNFA